MLPDLLERRRTRFVLWRPAHVEPRPALLIGPVPAPGQPPVWRELPLDQNPEFPELWEREAQGCGLEDGRVYLYWFRVRDSQPYDTSRRVLYCTDPCAWAVDRRFTAPVPAGPDGQPSAAPPAVALYRDAALWPCDPGGQQADWSADGPVADLAPNQRLVIYELPTRWMRADDGTERKAGVGTFEDVLALIEPDSPAPGFANVPGLGAGRALLRELGVNALELLPLADSDDQLGWGYGSAHYFAPDFDLGGGTAERAPKAVSGLAGLVAACHRQGLRFFADLVMAFARQCPYRSVNFPDFFVHWNAGDPEQGSRNGFGGDLFRYQHWVDGYDPITGMNGRFVPARELMKLQAAHWLSHYRLDGLRLDSVDNTGSYDFLQEFKDAARARWRTQPRTGTLEPAAREERFLVVGEELDMPLALVAERRLDGLWNERFKQIARQVLLGRPWERLSFEESVRCLIDCRGLGFEDGAQAVNYLTSHDVGGPAHARLHDYLSAQGVADLERRIKLAFVCLLTAVGIPMILAGEEFADQHDLSVADEHAGEKQIDPVDFARLHEPWRRRVFEHVARLVHFRTRPSALARNETAFLHADFHDGKRVLAWQRGQAEDLVVVVANFSDWGTPDPHTASAEYAVPGFPTLPDGRAWREITQARDVPAEWAGREPLYPWEAKVYVPA